MVMENKYPNWFAHDAYSYFERNTAKLKDLPITALQIGAYTGDASLWLMENIMTHEDSKLFDIDTWRGSDEDVHKKFDWSDIKNTYYSKVKPYIESNKIIPVESKSVDFLRSCTTEFDFVYIDGNHEAYAVLEDFIFVFDLVKIGGIVAFDDYTWIGGLPPHKRPAMAIDSILECYQDKIKVIDSGNQIWVKKIGI